MAITSSTGTVVGSDITYTMVGSGYAKGDGVIAYINYTKSGSDSVSIVFSYNDAKISSTNFYKQVTIESGAITAQSFSIGSTGLYRLPISIANNEEIVKVTVSGLDLGTFNIEFNIDNPYN